MNEAERLAEKLENHELTWGYREYSDKAAAELRRLSAINAELVEALESIAKDEYDKWSNGARAQRTALQALEKAKKPVEQVKSSTQPEKTFAQKAGEFLKSKDWP